MTFNNAGVFYPEETNPDAGGGPIRRSGLVVTRSGDGMPPHGWPQMVQRTPHQAVYEPEDGGAGYAWFVGKKFLPDGRIVDAGALGATATAMSATTPAADAARRLALWGVVGSALAGLAIGAATSSRRFRGAGAGLVLGAGSGLVLTSIAGYAATLGAELVAAKGKTA